MEYETSPLVKLMKLWACDPICHADVCLAGALSWLAADMLATTGAATAQNRSLFWKIALDMLLGHCRL